MRAKIATDFGKPQGVFELTRDNWFEVMGDRPTIALWGVGSKISQRLAAHGYQTVRDLAEADDATLVAEFGPTMGPHYGRLGRGVSSATVDDTPWIARAHGRETTYQTNLVEPQEIADAIHALAAQVVEDIRREERACQRVFLKVRFAPFFTTNRVRKLAEPTFDAEVIAHDRPRPARRAGGRPADPAAGCPGRDGAARGRLRRPAHHRARRSQCPCRTTAPGGATEEVTPDAVTVAASVARGPRPRR